MLIVSKDNNNVCGALGSTEIGHDAGMNSLYCRLTKGKCSCFIHEQIIWSTISSISDCVHTYPMSYSCIPLYDLSLAHQ